MFGVADRISLGVATEHGQGDGRVDEHAEEPQDEAHDHGPKAALGIQAFEKHAEEKDHEDRRRQIALHGLQVVV